ncbi:MAG: hypothetical protein K8H88_13130, partial [Sandaracinaceae bacterium]|nr:hypothetical protein [Sandaracinaceae bacterium]
MDRHAAAVFGRGLPDLVVVHESRRCKVLCGDLVLCRLSLRSLVRVDVGLQLVALGGRVAGAAHEVWKSWHDDAGDAATERDELQSDIDPDEASERKPTQDEV